MSNTAKEVASEHPYGWVIVAISTIALALGFGAGGVVSVLMKPLEEEFGWFRADISMAYTAYSIGAALGGLFWGAMSDRIGAKPVALIGVFGMAAGLAALKWQGAQWQLDLLFFLIGAVGFACLFTPLTALTGLWFSARKGLAIGIATAGGAFGQGIVPYLDRLLITELGWRNAMLVTGLVFLIILLPLMFFLRPAPVAAQAPGQAAARDTNLWNVPHSVTLPWLGLAALFCCICMTAPQVHLIPLGIDIGCSPQTAAGLLLTVMVTAVFGRLFFGWLADRIGGLKSYFMASAAQTSVVFFFTQTKSIAVLYQLAVLFGFGFAGVMTCLLICAREAAPLRLSAFAMSVVATVGWIGMGLGSYQAGFFYDISANYRLSFANAAGAGVLNLIVVAALIWYRRERNLLQSRAVATTTHWPGA